MRGTRPRSPPPARKPTLSVGLREHFAPMWSSWRRRATWNTTRSATSSSVPTSPLSQFHAVWEEALQQAGQNPTAKAWRNTCSDIADGFVWNLTFLNRFRGNASFPEQELRVVDFHDLFTVPRSFLEGLSHRRVRARLRLMPPYREHLSQAFARYFMRVGLPAPLDRTW